MVLMFQKEVADRILAESNTKNYGRLSIISNWKLDIKKEFDITNTTQKVDLRARGRQAKVRVSCAANNASWKWGSIRLALQGDGGR